MSIHDTNKQFEAQGAQMLVGRDGYDNYFLLGTFPEFGAQASMRARVIMSKKGTTASFKFRLTPLPGAEMGNWKHACPTLKWTAADAGRVRACFGIGLAAWTRDEVLLSLKDVGYPKVLDNWLTALGLTWDPKQRELLPSYLEEAERALFGDEYGDGTVVEVEGRVKHAARFIVPEEQIWANSSGAALGVAAPIGGAFANEDEPFALTSDDDADDDDAGFDLIHDDDE